MEEKINHYLTQLEKEKNITILLACETGSRAWGFPSPDSDYDVRIIYKKSKENYLKLTENKDAFDLMFENNDIDISGWDLKKSLLLLMKSNAALLERIQSPIVYKVDQSFLAGIQELAGKSYSKIATMYHYLGLAKNSFSEVESFESYKLKKFFYALRAAVACEWILEKNVMPPIELNVMLENLPLDKLLVTKIYALIDLKKTVDESYMHSSDAELIAFIRNTIDKSEQQIKSLPSSKFNLDEFDQFFIDQLK